MKTKKVLAILILGLMVYQAKVSPQVALGTTTQDPIPKFPNNQTKVSPQVALGTTTQDRIPKFLNNKGGLTDSVIYESAGKIGIGTTSPSAKLEVAGQVKITGGSPGANKVLTSSDANGLATWQTLSGTGDNLGNHTATQNIKLNGHYLSGDGGNEGVYVTNDGKVGIGTTSPGQPLQVHSDVTPTVGMGGSIKISDNLQDWTMGLVYDNENRHFAIASGSVERFVINTSTGNVGIGTTNPARKLHISDVMRLQPRATAPSDPAEGDIYMDSTDHKLKVYDGTTWQACW